MANFSASEIQRIKISFQLKEFMAFPNSLGDDTVEDFMFNVAEAVMNNCNGDLNDWEITEYDGEDDGNLLLGVTYNIEVTASVSVSGYCEYDPGRTYGDPYDCYPGYIDDVDYEDGMIDSCDTNAVLEVFPELANISVNIGEISGDAEIELYD